MGAHPPRVSSAGSRLRRMPDRGPVAGPAETRTAAGLRAA
jgi:hypothetical protein